MLRLNSIKMTLLSCWSTKSEGTIWESLHKKHEKIILTILVYFTCNEGGENFNISAWRIWIYLMEMIEVSRQPPAYKYYEDARPPSWSGPLLLQLSTFCVCFLAWDFRSLSWVYNINIYRTYLFSRFYHISLITW